ncbi:MAG TPA: cell wall hydrolase [Rhizomicrobium sp.]|nr:cell wall hydrolase [Rhizomicrobium sp.]
MMMRPNDLLALNLVMEAGLEPDDGKAAIARVVKNRMARKYESDGTISGTVLKRDQFSWAWFDFVESHSGTSVHGHSAKKYVQVCYSDADALARAEGLLARQPLPALVHCRDIGARVFAETYRGADYDRLTDDAVLYLNPRIVSDMPDWAAADKLICSIGRHDFYRA